MCKRLLFFSALVLALTQALPTVAGGLHINEATIDDKSQASLTPGDVYKFCASGDIYLYSGAPNEIPYMVVLVKKTDLPRRHVPSSGFGKNLRVSVLPLTHDSGAGLTCAYFKAPIAPGSYYFEYGILPLFTERKIGELVAPNTIYVEDPNRYPDLRRFLMETRGGEWEEMPQVSLSVAQKPVASERPPTVVLQVNGQYPVSSRPLIEPGYSESPAVFTWAANNSKQYEMQHRYRLFYMDTEYSEWGGFNQAAYAFIYPGTHTFRVQSRYRKAADQDWQELGEATYTFKIERAFISGSVAKGFGATSSNAQPLLKPHEVYKRSIVVVIAVSKFDHADNWQPLPFTQYDAAAVAQTFAAKGFDVKLLDAEPTSRNIIDFVDGVANQAQAGDRIVLYFSTHGFKDVNSEKVYLASSDCDPARVNTTCVSLAYLQDAVSRIQQQAKHSLVILDACAAGLGIMPKSLLVHEFYESAILLKPGSHMITAGMADQEAQPDDSSQMSEFTKFLVKGIKGEADSNKDGVVTLLELMAFVRGSVAKETNGEQIPMMGRLSGDGEMVF